MNQRLIELNKIDVKLEIAELKQFLADTDYVTLKIVEGVATREDYIEILQNRENARIRIRELEEEL